MNDRCGDISSIHSGRDRDDHIATREQLENLLQSNNMILSNLLSTPGHSLVLANSLMQNSLEIFAKINALGVGGTTPRSAGYVGGVKDGNVAKSSPTSTRVALEPEGPFEGPSTVRPTVARGVLDPEESFVEPVISSVRNARFEEEKSAEVTVKSEDVIVEETMLQEEESAPEESLRKPDPPSSGTLKIPQGSCIAKEEIGIVGWKAMLSRNDCVKNLNGRNFANEKLEEVDATISSINTISVSLSPVSIGADALNRIDPPEEGSFMYERANYHSQDPPVEGQLQSGGAAMADLPTFVEKDPEEVTTSFSRGALEPEKSDVNANIEVCGKMINLEPVGVLTEQMDSSMSADSSKNVEELRKESNVPPLPCIHDFKEKEFDETPHDQSSLSVIKSVMSGDGVVVDLTVIDTIEEENVDAAEVNTVSVVDLQKLFFVDCKEERDALLGFSMPVVDIAGAPFIYSGDVAHTSEDGCGPHRPFDPGDISRPFDPGIELDLMSDTNVTCSRYEIDDLQFTFASSNSITLIENYTDLVHRDRIKDTKDLRISKFGGSGDPANDKVMASLNVQIPLKRIVLRKGPSIRHLELVLTLL